MVQHVLEKSVPDTYRRVNEILEVAWREPAGFATLAKALRILQAPRLPGSAPAHQRDEAAARL